MDVNLKNKNSAAVGSNSNRKNGKAAKKNPKKNKATGKTVGGYSLEKLAERRRKRGGA